MMNNPQYNSIKMIVIIAVIAVGGFFVYKNVADTGTNQSGSVILGTPTTTPDGYNPFWLNGSNHGSGPGTPCWYVSSQGGFIGVVGMFGACFPTEWFITMTPPSDNTVPEDSIKTPIKDINVSLADGSMLITGEQPWVAQAQLFLLGYLKTAPTGKVDADTAEALAQYQSEQRLRVTGVLDPETVASLGAMLAKVSTPQEEKK